VIDHGVKHKYVVYLRVSTQKQGQSGLGLEAQQTTVQTFLRSQGEVEILAEKTEVESGKRDDRPVLTECIQLCKKSGATLLVATLSRLTRSLAFLTQIEASGIAIKCADFPEMNSLVLHLLGAINNYELDLVRTRTSNALQALKRRGVKLGNPRPDIAKLNDGARQAKVDFASKMASIVAEIRSSGVDTLQGIADCLNRRGYATRTGKQWFPASVRNLMAAIPA